MKVLSPNLIWKGYKEKISTVALDGDFFFLLYLKIRFISLITKKIIKITKKIPNIPFAAIGRVCKKISILISITFLSNFSLADKGDNQSTRNNRCNLTRNICSRCVH